MFSRLTASVEEKQSRGTVKRILESNADIAEIKDLLIKISARIEAFVVSVASVFKVMLMVITVREYD